MNMTKLMDPLLVAAQKHGLIPHMVWKELVGRNRGSVLCIL